MRGKVKGIGTNSTNATKRGGVKSNNVYGGPK
jgi:hypothetical protein